VHVNGYFEVSSNRRDIWYGADMDRGGKLRSDWNRLLLEDVVAPLFRELLLELRMLSDSTTSYYSLWPTGLYEDPWSILVEKIYKVIYSHPVLHSEVEGGAWISPANALLHDEGFSRSNDLNEALVLLGMPVVCLPNVIVDMFSKFYTKSMLKIVSPATVRHLLKDFGKLAKLGKSHKLVLLEYCLLDLDSADIGECMNGLPLIPLANMQFGIFSESPQGDHYYVCDNMEYELLSGVGDRLVDRNTPPVLLDQLYQLASNSQANISLIDGPIFLQLFPRLFPPGWKCLNQVPWNSGLGVSSPTAAWFKLFWQYIGERSYDLDLFSDWPILPSTSGHLYRSTTGSKLIKTESLSNLMNGLLAKLGCKILDTEYLSEHRQLSHYVYDGDATGVLHAIFETVSLEGVELQSLFQRITPGERNELYQFLLDAKWYIGGCISDMSINQCKRLPIFRVFNERSASSYGFSDLSSSRKYLPPLGVPDYLLNTDFIFCIRGSDEDIIMRYYSVERMLKSNFYRRYVLNRLDELQTELRDSVLLTILQDLPQLSMEDPMFKEALKVLKFVPTLNGTLKSPQSLYDPRVEELYILLQESDCFPHGSFQNPDILDMLLCLGLQTSVSTDTIIQSARQIDSLVNIDQQKAHSRGKVLLSYLEVHAHKWYVNKPHDGWKTVNMLAKVTTALRSRDKSCEFDLEKFWSDLRMICWCPVLVTAPCPALPWPSVSSMIAPPKQVRMQEDMWIVSASSRILDGECNSSALSHCLGWSSLPSGSVIAAQLLELGKNNEIVTDQVLRQELALVMPKIYSLLTNLIGSDEMDIVKVVLEGCRWIWVGDGFAKADEVVLSGHLHLAPYIRVVPIDLAVFKDLFLELGIKEHLQPVDYVGILSRMAIRKASVSLDAEELRTAVLLVQHLSEFRFQDQPTQIYLPDSSARLCLSSELVFNDAPWLLEFGNDVSGGASSLALSSKKHVHNFVHGNISSDVAERLGVRSLRRLLLAESSDSMNLSLSGAAEAFGQHEDLTTRLKHIVEMYADGPGILFELVQNAEDAKASEVVFLLDKTQYGTSSVLSPEMAEWQGPALYCFNDSVFSPQDLYAISRIGQDSKLEKPFAIGRFGLGFNCVYHFTDIPGFVSGENVVMFDPHACYLPGISPSHPGLRIKFVGRRILEQFPDQFSPFLHFGCNLQQPFPGTLFRFPLRNEAAASRSQIKREQYAPQDVEMLFSSFSEVVSEALLFLRNVKKITLYVKENSHEEMGLVHCVSKHDSPQITKEPHPLNTMFEFIRGNQPSGMDRSQFFSKLNKTKDTELPWSCQKVAILEQKPTAHMVHLWILAECIGGGRARKLSTASGSKSHFFVPWASVAAYLHSVNVEDTKAPAEEAEVNHDNLVFKNLELGSSRDRQTFEGRAFCFLPLPINTSIPVHVNAYFELSSNRRDIWIGNDMAGGGRIRSEWNLALLEDVVAPAYGHLLAAIAEELGPSDLFLSFWPSAVAIEPWSSMVRKLYVSIAELGLNVLYTKARGGHWISTRQAIFPDFSFSKACELAEVLSQAGLPIVSVPKPAVDGFSNAYPSVHLLNPQLLRNLLIRRKRGFKSREEAILVLEYCLSDIGDPSFSDKLQGLPLLPLANGSFTTFNKRWEGERVFFVSQIEFDLLKESIPHLVIDNSIPDDILKKLYDIAHSARLNMYLFTCNFLLELFPRILPPEWQHANQLSWSPEQQGQPSVEWMVSLWKFLRYSCDDISIFAKWPILPLVDGKIVQLGNASNVIRDGGWSENMYSLLQKLGCFFLRSDLQIEHPQLANFVQESTAAGVLNAVQSIASNFQDMKELFLSTSFAETHELRSFIFQSKWFSGDQIISSHMNTISNLPIFESYKSRKLVSLTNPRKWLKPEGVHEDLLNENFIRTDSAREKSILISYFDIREPQKAEFYKDHVLPRISEFLSEPAVVSAIIRDVNLLIENDSIKAALCETPFVLAANGEWVQPSRSVSLSLPPPSCVVQQQQPSLLVPSKLGVG
jgi:sacsin